MRRAPRGAPEERRRSTPLLRARLALAVSLALALGACDAAPPPVQTWRWDKPDVNDETFARDRYYCVSGATRPTGFLGRPEVDPERFAACMAVRGYTRNDAGRLGPRPEKPVESPRG